MGKQKTVALTHAKESAASKVDAYDASNSKLQKQLHAPSKPVIPHSNERDKPSRFTYALRQYSCERRSDGGWWIARTPFGAAGVNITEWTGPFEAIETAVLAIGRRLATEVADRHTRSIEVHKITISDPLYGLKPTTRLKQKTKVSSM